MHFYLEIATKTLSPLEVELRSLLDGQEYDISYLVEHLEENGIRSLADCQEGKNHTIFSRYMVNARH